MIRMKYVSKKGKLEDCEGELFHYKGYQYCLSYINKIWTAHEITTGRLILNLSAWDNYSLGAKEAKAKLKDKLISNFEKNGRYYEERIISAIVENKDYGLGYPVNHPILNN